MKIVVDAGHGSDTAGKCTQAISTAIDFDNDGMIDMKKEQAIREHIASVRVTDFLAIELERCGLKTIKTGGDEDIIYDNDEYFWKRQNAIATANCDYSIRILFNSFGDASRMHSAEGIRIYIHNKYVGQSKKLAEIILKHLVKGSKNINKGVTPAGLAMCDCNNMDVKGAVLIEFTSKTDPYEAANFIVSEANAKAAAQKICKGICEYTGIKYIIESVHSEH